MTILKTARLTLRPARESDVDGMHVLFSDPETMRYWSRPPHTSIEQTRAQLASILDAGDASDELIIEHEGTVAGKVGMYRLPEIGFILRRDLWGRGLMLEAASALIAHVWTKYDVPALKADVDPRNEASLRLLGRLGFVRTGFAERTFCVGDQWVDSVYLTLDRPR